jgi:hypothetical protein
VSISERAILSALPERLEFQKAALEAFQKHQEAAKEELSNPFPQQAELALVAFQHGPALLKGNIDAEPVNAQPLVKIKQLVGVPLFRLSRISAKAFWTSRATPSVSSRLSIEFIKRDSPSSPISRRSSCSAGTARPRNFYQHLWRKRRLAFAASISLALTIFCADSAVIAECG